MKQNRDELIEKINHEGRRMSTATVVFHQAVAESAGIPGTDHKYLDVILNEGAMTAGKLARLTGLTTGAVTGIIDRLEKSGFVKRKRDPGDRRKVLVVPETEYAMNQLGPVFMKLQQELDTFYERFSDDELVTIHKYLQNVSGFFEEKSSEIREGGV